MQQIFINGRFLTQEITGVQRVGIETLRELQKKSKFNNLTILIPNSEIKVEKDFFREFNIVVLNNFFNMKGHLWEQLILGPYMKKNKGLLINFCNTAPILLKEQIVYIHDTAIFEYPKAYNYKFILWYKIMYKFIKRCTIITVSDFSKRQLKNFLDLNNVHTIYNGIDHLKNINTSDEQGILEKLNVEEKEYYLTVGSKNPNKNQQLIEKLSELNIDKKFIIVGSDNKSFSEVSSKQKSNCIYTGYLNDEDLKVLYKNAKTFIFPSLYEGFGIPPFEALINNTPVISSNRASLEELLEEYAILIDPESLTDLNSVINNKESEQILSKKLSVFKSTPLKYTWSNSAEKLTEIITNKIM